MNRDAEHKKLLGEFFELRSKFEELQEDVERLKGIETAAYIEAYHNEILRQFEGHDSQMEIQIRANVLCGRFGQTIAGLVIVLREEKEQK